MAGALSFWCSPELDRNTFWVLCRTAQHVQMEKQEDFRRDVANSVAGCTLAILSLKDDIEKLQRRMASAGQQADAMQQVGVMLLQYEMCFVSRPAVLL